MLRDFFAYFHINQLGKSSGQNSLKNKNLIQKKIQKYSCNLKMFIYNLYLFYLFTYFIAERPRKAEIVNMIIHFEIGYVSYSC